MGLERWGGEVDRGRSQSWKGGRQRGEETEEGRREEKADKLVSLDSLGTNSWDSDQWPGQYPEPGFPEDWLLGGTSGRGWGRM